MACRPTTPLFSKTERSNLTMKPFSLILAFMFFFMGCDSAPLSTCIPPEPDMTLTFYPCSNGIESRCEWLGKAPEYNLHSAGTCVTDNVVCVEVCNEN